MPRTYVRKHGSKATKNYSEEDMEFALVEILDSKISITKAVIKYKIPKGTLINRIHGR
jgi:hypothetical protein